jgi:hypothetical protein
MTGSVAVNCKVSATSISGLDGEMVMVGGVPSPVVGPTVATGLQARRKTTARQLSVVSFMSSPSKNEFYFHWEGRASKERHG